MAINYTYPAKSTPTTSDEVLIIDNEDTTNPQSTKTATIQSIVSLATGSGDVTGPASSIDNSIAVYDGTTGKVIKNDTGVTIDANSNVVLENWPESDGEFRGDVDGGIRFTAQADGALSKGDVVYISGVSGANTLVAKAQANSSSTMPAFGFVNRAALSGATVQIITFGNIYGSGTYPLDTTTDSESNPLTVGDTIYVSSTVAGGYTNVKPSGETNLIQNIGKIVRVNANNGVIKAGGAGRTNATPNLDSAKIFVGNASNYAASVAMSGDVTIDNAGVTTVNATITNGAAAGAVALPLAGGEMSGTIAGNQNIIGKRPTIVDTKDCYKPYVGVVNDPSVIVRGGTLRDYKGLSGDKLITDYENIFIMGPSDRYVPIDQSQWQFNSGRLLGFQHLAINPVAGMQHSGGYRGASFASSSTSGKAVAPFC